MSGEQKNTNEEIDFLKNELQKYQEKNQELQHQLNSTRDAWTGHWEMDLVTKGVSWSPEVYHILDIDETSKPDMRLFNKRLPDACRDKLNGAISKVFVSGEEYSFEHFVMHGEELRPTRSDIKPVFNEARQPIKLLGKITDITNIKSEHKELERLSLIAAHTSNAVVMLGTDAKVEWINSAFTMMTGYRPDEIVGEEFKLIFADVESKMCSQDELKEVFRHTRSVLKETEILAKNGLVHTTVFNVSPLLDYELNPEGYIAIITDITEQKETERLLAQKNKEITDSITYAQNLQRAILPSDEELQTELKNAFIYFQPKDIVSGDFYWMEKVGDEVIFAVADCTGHGVPGAMVSVVCVNALNRCVREFGMKQPAEILDKTRELVIRTFEKSSDNVKDGMDISLCSVNFMNSTAQWAGANNPLWIVRDGLEELEEIKADKQPIGKYAESKPFTNHQIKLNKGDSIYLFTDGYPDQFGGPKGKKFKYKPFKRLFVDIQDKSMFDRKMILENTLDIWMENVEQIDDVCIIGVQI